MSIQRTAQSVVHALEELYNAIDISHQRPDAMSVNDSENIVHALCDLSQLIDHINQTGMCGQTPVKTTNFDSNRFDRRKMKNFFSSHLNNYDENMIMDSATVGPPPQPGQPYGECIFYHPFHITTKNSPYELTVSHENDFARKKEPFRKDHDHNKRFPPSIQRKKNRRRASVSHGRRSKSSSRVSRSGSRTSRLSRRSRRSSHRRVSRSHGRNSRSSRRSRSRSSRRKSRNSKSGYRRSSSRGRKSRSSQKGRRRSRSSQRRSRSRRRSSHKRRSADQKYHTHPIPSQPMPTATGPSAPAYLSNQTGAIPMANQPFTQQPYIRSQPTSIPMANTSNGSPLHPPQILTPTLPLLPPPTVSSMHPSYPPSQMLMPQHHQPPIPSILHGSNTPIHRPTTNLLNDQSSSYQQAPLLPTNLGNTTPSQEQPPSLLSSTDSAQLIPTQNSLLFSSATPLPATNSIFTSRSDNCPECRAITRLLQWAPLKCYDAAGIRRGVFLAGPKSEQLLKALYSSMKDASLSLDDIEDCICDNESNK